MSSIPCQDLPNGLCIDVYKRQAYKEGEGDKSLAYWRQVHEDFFKDCLGEAGLTFTPDSKVVLEEFRKVYPL